MRTLSIAALQTAHRATWWLGGAMGLAQGIALYALSEIRRGPLAGDSGQAAALRQRPFVESQSEPELRRRRARYRRHVQLAGVLRGGALGVLQGGLGPAHELGVEGRHRALHLGVQPVEAFVGDKNRAISTLQHLLEIPYSDCVTPALLRLDPKWDPLRGDPRFQKLCEEKKQ